MSYKIASEEVSDKLCGLCTISLDVCSASSSGNAFTGNDGALECMAAGQGDVAFVKHTTLQEAADKNPKWNVSDYQHYQYLCKDGTREGRSVADQDLQIRGGEGGGGWEFKKIHTSKPSVLIRVDTTSNADLVLSLAQDTQSHRLVPHFIELYKCRGTGQLINLPG